jgi:hypothetical protein
VIVGGKDLLANFQSNRVDNILTEESFILLFRLPPVVVCRRQTWLLDFGSLVVVTISALAVLVIFSPDPLGAVQEPVKDEPHVIASEPVAAGRDIITIAGCNDCHTPGAQYPASRSSSAYALQPT